MGDKYNTKNKLKIDQHFTKIWQVLDTKKCVLFGKFGQVDSQTADPSIFKLFYLKNKDNYNE